MRVLRFKDPRYGSNVFLIQSARPHLVDAGGSPNDGLLGWLEGHLEVPLAGAVFTHGHPDHVGGAAAVAAAWPVPLQIHRAELDRIPGAVPLGDAVDLGDARLSVLHTPGHSPGGVSLFEPRFGWLFTGDCAFSGGRVGRWDLPGADYRALCASLDALLDLDVRALYPGHHDPVQGDVRAHLQASRETLNAVGETFDDDAYDARIADLQARW